MPGRSNPRARSNADQGSVAQSLQEYGRGIAGGLLFSMPLLYTNEVWDAGFAMPPVRQLAYLGLTLVLLFGYNRFAGLRRDSSWAEVGIDSVEELGIGLLLSALLLYALGRISGGQPVDEVLGRIAVEGMTVAIGVSVGTAQLGAGNAGDTSQDEEPAGYGGQLVLAFCGAVLFAANMAPTEEVVVLGVELAAGQLIAVALLSLALGGLILFFSDFRGSRRSVHSGDPGAVLRGTVVTYAAALLASAGILWIFGRFDGVSPPIALGETVALGMAATLGASAGRLLIQLQAQ